jgi:protocatechuate 3,4-dioxygenase beta subunit
MVDAPATASGNLTVKGASSVGTKVKLKNQTTGVVRKTSTDASGKFSFAGAAPGKYKITISPVPVP